MDVVNDFIKSDKTEEEELQEKTDHVQDLSRTYISIDCINVSDLNKIEFVPNPNLKKFLLGTLNDKDIKLSLDFAKYYPNLETFGISQKESDRTDFLPHVDLSGSSLRGLKSLQSLSMRGNVTIPDFELSDYPRLRRLVFRGQVCENQDITKLFDDKEINVPDFNKLSLSQIDISAIDFSFLTTSKRGIEIRINQCDMPEIPDNLLQVLQQIRIERLVLSSNGIQSIPDVLFELHDLKELTLSSNPIDKLPRSILKLALRHKLHEYNYISESFSISFRKTNLPYYITQLTFSGHDDFIPKLREYFAELEDDQV